MFQLLTFVHHQYALHTIISLNMIIFGCGYTYVVDDDDYDDNNVYYTIISIYQGWLTRRRPRQWRSNASVSH
jgi:hypothetical protein